MTRPATPPVGRATADSFIAFEGKREDVNTIPEVRRITPELSRSADFSIERALWKLDDPGSVSRSIYGKPLTDR